MFSTVLMNDLRPDPACVEDLVPAAKISLAPLRNPWTTRHFTRGIFETPCFENRLQLRTLGYFFLHEEFCQILQRLPMGPEKIADLYMGLS